MAMFFMVDYFANKIALGAGVWGVGHETTFSKTSLHSNGFSSSRLML